MEDKFEYLNKVHNAGVCNIEMEALLFLAFAQRAHVRAGVLCTVIVNRLKVYIHLYSIIIRVIKLLQLMNN